MSTLDAGQRTTEHLPTYSILTVVAEAGSGSVVRLGDKVGDRPLGFSLVAVGETKILGPFSQPTRHEVICDAGILTYTVAVADFPAVTSDVERIVKITQTDYDALDVPDETTLYMIVADPV